jgi:hypothetical protein
MRRAIIFWSLVAILLLVPIRAAQESAPGELSPPPKTVEITGTVQSFTSNILDVKPADAPSVWIAIPADLRVDRGALTDGAKVTAKAHWVFTCFVATAVTVQK